MEAILLRKKQIAIISIFIIVITCFDLYFQWSNFFQLSVVNNYTYSFPASLLFLLEWLLFSFYWGLDKDKKYQKFITVYWGINIFVVIVIVIFANNNFIQEVLFLLYIWYQAPLSGLGVEYLPWLNNGGHTAVLITSTLGMLFSYIGFWLGLFVSKWTKSDI